MIICFVQTRLQFAKTLGVLKLLQYGPWIINVCFLKQNYQVLAMVFSVLIITLSVLILYLKHLWGTVKMTFVAVKYHIQHIIVKQSNR